MEQRSRWMWGVWLGMGLLSFIAFVVVALRVQRGKFRRKFRRAAVIASVSCAISIGAYVIWPPVETTSKSTGTDASSDSLAGTNGVWVVMAVWVGLIAYGHYLDRDYRKFLRAEDEQTLLQWHANRAQVRAFYEPGGVPSVAAYGASLPTPTPPPTPVAPPVNHLIEQADKYLATQPPGNRPGPLPPNAPGT
jgi:hypothetical protein